MIQTMIKWPISEDEEPLSALYCFTEARIRRNHACRLVAIMLCKRIVQAILLLSCLQEYMEPITFFNITQSLQSFSNRGVSLVSEPWQLPTVRTYGTYRKPSSHAGTMEQYKRLSICKHSWKIAAAKFRKSGSWLTWKMTNVEVLLSSTSPTPPHWKQLWAATAKNIKENPWP